MYCTAAELANESDVEQKFAWALLTTDSPLGLGYASTDILTKPDLRQLTIDKGTQQKQYHPDYVVHLAGIPVLVVEAKHPNIDPRTALREARLYADELNASYPSGINPCQRVIATNGLRTVSSPVDSVKHDIDFPLTDASPACQQFEELISLISKQVAEEHASKVRRSISPATLIRALDFVGGGTTANQEVAYNEFGSRLAIDYRDIFNPESREARALIVKKAYVPSALRDTYLDEIDRVIKNAATVEIPNAREFASTGDPKELFRAIDKEIKADSDLSNLIFLLVGARGAGKTTFIDYCREVKFDASALKTMQWVHLNLNRAPADRPMLERWSLDEVIETLRRDYPNEDFDDDLEMIFATEVRRLKRGPLKGLPADSVEYQSRLADKLLQLQDDPVGYARALARYVCRKHRRLLIIAFDNSDKRDRDQQLRAFEVARWLQQQFQCIIIMPIRDVTYDAYSAEPPLDTVIKDFVFRIDPPLFTEILQKRFGLVLEQIVARSDKYLEFHLESGVPVKYPAEELGVYLLSVFQSLYSYDKVIRSLILGLAGRDIRRAMEIFLEFCRSGHIGPAEYMKIRASKGRYRLPYHLVNTVLLRPNRRFYSGDASFIKNLFQTDPDDGAPDWFLRADILQWLRTKHGEVGPSGMRGFFQVKSLVEGIAPLGHVPERISKEAGYLLRSGCILSEHQRNELRSENDLICLSPSGFVHLEMLDEPGYLAACAEETWVSDDALARRVASRIAAFGHKIHMSAATMAENAREFLTWLSLAEEHRLAPDAYMEHPFLGAMPNREEFERKLATALESAQKAWKWDEADACFSGGLEVRGTVTGVAYFGCFVLLDGGPTGLAHQTQLPKGRAPQSFEIGTRVLVRILEVEASEKRVSLKILAEIPSP